MADINITLKIPSDKVSKVVESICKVQPVPKIRNDEGDLIAQYSDNDWSKEWLRRQIINVVRRADEITAIQAARTAEIDNAVAEIVAEK